MSFSRMAAFDLSPRHYLWERAHPKEQTPAMAFGSAFHKYVLETDEFENTYVSAPENAPRRPTSAQINAKKPSDETLISVAFWEDFENTRNGRNIISPEDLAKIKRMHEQIMENPRANELIMQLTNTERPLEWTDPETGVLCKGRFDGDTENYTIDLKTCECAQPDVFSRTAWNYSMHKQSSFYVDGRVYSGKFHKKGDFYFIAVEKDEPHGVTVMKANRDFISLGRQQYVQTLENFNHWCMMGRPDVCYEWQSPFGEFTLKPPRWAF